ncbi:MAG: Transcriptional regulator PerR [Planctomycetes bacterium ADurb.Bin126]|nr:MAG: Transcriptional regulator PerR [Planctomycetes bacterium ADurb.Bin126]HOD83779.1 transcriptional repressor [Phycisphaerae bacterium]HQL73647.1 transcriptional repressor [Phycisphaerae bacterium]
MRKDESELDRQMRAFAETCRAKGLKATHQRMEIYRQLAATQQHPDAETVYRNVRRRVPSISRDTVYRTLATLEDHGLVRKVEALAGPTRFDANTERHHHFICTVCGAIKDFSSPALNDLPIPPSVRSYGAIESAQVQVRGVCAACAGRGR